MKLWQNGGFKASIGDHLTALARAQRETKFVVPGQHVKLPQHRDSEPTVPGHLANEPAKPTQQVSMAAS